MLRYEEIFNYYSEEPATFKVKEEADSDASNYEEILRIRKWNSGGRSYSWSIYSNEREEFSHCATFTIRQVVWDLSCDKKDAQNRIKKFREDLLEEWPTICTKNYCIDSKYNDEIIYHIEMLDGAIRNGINISNNDMPLWDWKDLELKRLLDWGNIQCTWSNNMQSKEVEGIILHIEKKLEDIICKPHRERYSIDMNYSILPDFFDSYMME
jgi:hypothetical protein